MIADRLTLTGPRAGLRAALAVMLVSVAALLSGCVSYGLSAQDVLFTDDNLRRSGETLSGKPLTQGDLGPDVVVTPETLSAGFGPIALTRLERDPARPLVVFCGGNIERQDVRGAMRWGEISPFGDVWLFDYPGFGRSGGEGSPAEFEALNAALANRIDQAFGQGGRTGGLVFWGYSFGGGVCAKLAATVRTASDVVLVATFRNFDSVVETTAGLFSWLVKPDIADDVPNTDVVETLREYRGSVIVLAARNDATVPYAASRRLERELKASGRTSRMVTLPSADHADIQKAPTFRPALQAAFAELRVGVPRGVE